MRKRLVYRADDVGYTHVFNEGTFLALDKGIVTSVDVMFDTPGTMEALEKLKEYPWLTIGWHRHLWGKPVLPPEEVSSMVDKEGWFYWHHDEYNQDDATYEDCFKEFEAQLELCKSVLGKYPFTATAATFSGRRPIDRAMIDVCKKYNILLNPSSHDHPAFGPYNPELAHIKLTSGRKKDLSITEENWRKKGRSRFDLALFKDYDPAATIIETQWDSNDEIKQVGGHPGFLDDYIMKESTCTIHRIKELEACMDERVFNWIIDNKIELVSVEDAINGTNKFQDHLKEINSPFWIGNMK